MNKKVKTVVNQTIKMDFNNYNNLRNIKQAI